MTASAAEEAQVEDAALALGQGAHGGHQHDPGLGLVHRRVLDRDGVAEHGVALLPDGEVERGGRVAAVGRQRLEDLVLTDAEVLGDLAHPGGAAQRLDELALGAAHVGLQHWIGRGGRTIHPKSRNCRLTSPFMVTTA